MAYCPRCDRVISRRDRFCRWCGQILDDEMGQLPRPTRIGRHWEEVACEHCSGTGIIDCRKCYAPGFGPLGYIVHPIENKPCPVCYRTKEEVCSDCLRSGRLTAWVS